MIRALLKMGAERFAQRYNYDTAYMSHIVDTSTAAGLRLSTLPLYSQFRGPKQARDVWAGAMLGSTQEGDCGPCVQLVVDMALESNVPAKLIVSCLEGNAGGAGDVGLGYRFAQAAIADTPDLAELRETIEERFGATALIAASFAASSGRIFPVLKRGLGHGQTCQSVQIDSTTIRVRHQT